MTNFEKYNSDPLAMSLRAVQLVYDFHAIRNPQTHPGFTEVEWYGPVPLLSGRSVEPSLESFVLSDHSSEEKATYVRRNYHPLMLGLLVEDPDAGPHELTAFCQAEIEDFDVPILGEPAADKVDVAAILPEQVILEAMQRTYVERDGTNCPSLVRFIDRHVA